jgi:hypothetical protein
MGAGQPAATRSSILHDVREAAKRHADSNAGKDSNYVLRVWGQNSAGVSEKELLQAYDEAYTAEKVAETKRDWIPKAGWLIAILLALALVFIERLKFALGKLIDFVGEALFNLFAAAPLFSRLALNRYCERLVERYSKLKIPFRPERPLELSSVFVPLAVTGPSESGGLVDAYVALAQHSKIVIKGSPGAGKSILLRHVAVTFARRRQMAWSKGVVPILVELNRLNEPTVLLREELERILRITGFPKCKRFIKHRLDHGGLLLLLDGLDEISAKQRPSVIQQIRDLADEFKSVQMVVSCRTQVYDGELDTAFDAAFQIQDFTDAQIRKFLRSWAPDMQLHGKSVNQLMGSLLERPSIMNLARNPLMLTIIAWLYTDTTVVLPQSRSEFYRRATELLLYDWKPESNVFQLVPKQLVLRDLALYFQDYADLNKQDSRSVELQTVLQRVSAVLPNLNIDAKVSALPMLEEIVDRSGLLLAIDGGERYQFAHLTLQEYFAASQLRNKGDELVARFKVDHNAWREPVKLWCGLDVDATTVVDAIYDLDPITAFECLADAQRVDTSVVASIIDEMKGRLLTGPADENLAKAFGLVASGLSERSSSVFKWLAENPSGPAFEALSYTNTPRAAQILAGYYESTADMPGMLAPDVRFLLRRRMGELAVPELLSLAQRGNINAVKDLHAVGTPSAAEALVPLLWDSTPEIKSQAAFALAALFKLPEVFTTLRELKIDRPNEADWVWKPFPEDEDTAIPVIAGRIVSLLETIGDMDSFPEAELDARLVLPSIAAAGSAQPKSGLRVVESSFSRIQAEMRAEANRRELANSSFDDKKEESPQAVEELLARMAVPRRWGSLIVRLSRPMQWDLIAGLTRLPVREDWLNILRPASFSAKRSVLLWAAISLIGLTVIFDVAYLGLVRRPFHLWVILVGLELSLGVAVQIAVFVSDTRTPTVPLLFMLTCTLSHPRLTGGNIKGLVTNFVDWEDFAIGLTMLLLFVAWIPSWITACMISFQPYVGRLSAILAISAIWIIAIGLAGQANRIFRQSENPFSYLHRYFAASPKPEIFARYHVPSMVSVLAGRGEKA